MIVKEYNTDAFFAISGVDLQWSEWGPCSESCQSNLKLAPFQVRNNNCQLSECSGATIQSRPCNAQVGCPGKLNHQIINF